MTCKKGQRPKRESENTHKKVAEMKAKMGRPLKYTEQEIERLADELVLFMKSPQGIWLKDFALNQDFDPAVLSDLADKNAYFSQALKKAKAIQESKIFKMSFGNKANATMGIFALKNCHEWKDGREFTGDPNRPINITTNIPLKFDEE